MNTDLGAGKRTKTTRFFGVRVYDYGFRFYDPELARFHTLDPLTEYFPRQSPFAYANNNPVRYIDVLGLSASDTTYIAPDIEPVYIVHTRPPAPTPWYQQAFAFVRQFLTPQGGRQIFANNPHGDYDANLPKTKHADSPIEAGLLGRDAPLPSLIGEKPLNIVGDDTGAIEATIKDIYKEHLDNCNEPAKNPYRTSRTPNGETTDLDGHTNQSFTEKWSNDSTSYKIVRKGTTDTLYYPPKHY